ncbi:MAG TPA: hypothetical protein PLP42_11215 [Acidobacteriota bacterium]|nr:hypothetical protein [Acidobacteriota bacterium]
MRECLNTETYDRFLAQRRDPYHLLESDYVAPGSPYTLGIILQESHYHKNYVAACREIGISYRLLDLKRDDWIETFLKSKCDAFLAWPSPERSIWKEMFDERLRILSEDLHQIIYPSLKELWLYENKRRTRDWLLAHRIPHPRSWVFFDAESARAFVRDATLPLIFKTTLGASSRGVWILTKRRKALHMVDKAFGAGITPRRALKYERQRGSVYFQEYLPNVQEWRMVRIGESFFGYKKGRVNEFHSGSRIKHWGAPAETLLALTREITDKGGFTSMNIDFFETEDGRYLVNEMHTVFGQSTIEQMRVGGKAGRYRFDQETQQWVFEEGDFARNACANARVKHLIENVLRHD